MNAFIELLPDDDRILAIKDTLGRCLSCPTGMARTRESFNRPLRCEIGTGDATNFAAWRLANVWSSLTFSGRSAADGPASSGSDEAIKPISQDSGHHSQKSFRRNASTDVNALPHIPTTRSLAMNGCSGCFV